MPINVVPRPANPAQTQSTGNGGAPAKQARQRAIEAMSRSNASDAPAPSSEAKESPTAAVAVSNAPSEIPEAKSDLVEALAEVQEIKDVSESESELSAATDSEETKPVAEAKSEAKDPLSQHYASMARKERALREKAKSQETTFIQREATLKAREEALLAKDAEYKAGYISKAEFQKNPWKHLADAGITYDQITEMELTKQAVPPQVLSQLERLESQLQEERSERKKFEELSKKSQEEQQSASYKQAVAVIRKDTESLVKDNPEFEMIANTDSIADVVELIEETFKEEGTLLSVEEAAAAVEKHLEEEALKLSRLKKIQSRLSSSTSKTDPNKVEVKFQANAKQQQKTLTNAIGAQKPISARDRAIQAMTAGIKK